MTNDTIIGFASTLKSPSGQDPQQSRVALEVRSTPHSLNMPMSSLLKLPPLCVDTDVVNTFSAVWELGQVTEHNRQEIKSALLYGNLTKEEHIVIDRLKHAVKRGWIRLS